MVKVNLYEAQSDQTVGEFISTNSNDTTFTADKFLNLVIAGSATNKTRIESKYTAQEVQDNSSKPSSAKLIKKGTQVGLPLASVKRKANKVIPPTFDWTSYKPFIAKQLKNLLEDPNYHSYLTDVNGQLIGRTEINDITVYAWIRSLSLAGDTTQQGSWVNLTPFVEMVQTNVGDGVGSFAMQLTPIAAQYLSEKWQMKNVSGYNDGGSRDDVLSVTHISQYKNKADNFASRTDFFFSTVLQENDLIFIRYEKLLSETTTKKVGEIGPSDVPNNIWDMIGLIDHVNVTTQPNSVSVIAQGRDLMKMLIEDGSYLFPEHLLPNMFTDPNSILTRRNLLDNIGKLMNGVTTFKPIDIILKYIFNKFSNIGIVPSSALSGYGERAIADKYELKSSVLSRVDTRIQDELSTAFLGEKREGLWRITDIVFDPNAANRILADSTIATDQGSIFNSIQKFCQQPFVEFYGDTYGDKYYYLLRKPPFDKVGYHGMVYNDVVSQEVLKSGIGIKDQILERQRDRSLERRANNGIVDQLSSLVITIDEVDVLAESLSYSPDSAYSWYRLTPSGLGISDVITSLKLCPTIALDEYAKVWGNKCFDMEYNYTPIQFIDDSSVNDQTKYIVDQVYLDLKYIIESTAYLPFTRQGSISIVGNRTIKKGTFIYYKPTDEVFHVDGVTNMKSLTRRETVLQVSRGMKEKFIKGVEIKFPSGTKLVNYFNIVPTPIETTALGDNQFLKKWTTDVDVFNFFLQRRQWTI